GAPNAHTVVFALREPLASFPQVTAMPLASPVRMEGVAAWTDGWRTTKNATLFVGNGPFVFKEWRAGDRLVFERNERYRQPVRVAVWTKRVVPDADTARVLYDAGRIDALAVTPRDLADREVLLSRPDLRRAVGPCTTYLGFNIARPPFDDQRVRLSFAKALDKDNYVTSVAKTGRIAFSLVPHGQPGHAHDDRAQAFDTVEARRLLASSRYGPPLNGLLGAIPVTFSFRPTLAEREFAMWVADQLQRNLGVRVVPEVVNSWGHGLVRRIEAQPQLYRLAWCEDYPDGRDWYASTIVFMSNRSRALSRTMRRSRPRASGTASTSASSSPGVTSTPPSAGTISGSAPRAYPTTGHPAVCASAATRPKGSSHSTGMSVTAA